MPVCFTQHYLLYLASHGFYRPKWSPEINDEWVRNLLKNRADLSVSQLQKTVKAMNRTFPEANVNKDLKRIIDHLNLPDPNDRHVLATAIHSNAEKIVTSNIKDFPTQYVNQFGILIQRPDNFICELIDIDSESALAALYEQVGNLKSPPLPINEVLNSLNRCGLKQTVLKIKFLRESE